VKKGTQEAAFAGQHFPDFVLDLSDLIAEDFSRSQAPLPERFRLSPVLMLTGIQRTVHVAAYVRNSSFAIGTTLR
jgi:hypothetical protein